MPVLWNIQLTFASVRILVYTINFHHYISSYPVGRRITRTMPEHAAPNNTLCVPTEATTQHARDNRCESSFSRHLECASPSLLKDTGKESESGYAADEEESEEAESIITTAAPTAINESESYPVPLNSTSWPGHSGSDVFDNSLQHERPTWLHIEDVGNNNNGNHPPRRRRRPREPGSADIWAALLRPFWWHGEYDSDNEYGGMSAGKTRRHYRASGSDEEDQDQSIWWQQRSSHQSSHDMVVGSLDMDVDRDALVF